MKFKSTGDHTLRNLTTRIVLIALTTVVIVWFLPRDERARFHYDIGRPWMYGDIIADFDFPILKSKETIDAEKDSVKKAFQPYFNFDLKVETSELARLRQDFKDGFPDLPKEYVSLVAERLDKIYQAGIVDASVYGDIAKDTTSMIRVVRGREAQSLKASFVFSTLTAYNMLFDDEKLGPHRQTLQKYNLNEYIEPNLIYDKERSEAELKDLQDGIPENYGAVLKDELIISRGQIVDSHTARVLYSYDEMLQRDKTKVVENRTKIAGQLLYVGLLVILFTLYLWLFRRDYFAKPRNITMLYTLIAVFPILVSLMMSHNFFNVYILPFAMTAIFTLVFLDSRTAFITHVTMVLICAAAVKYQYEFIIVQIVAGLVAIYALKDLYQRSQIIKTAVLVAVASCAIYFGIELMQSNDISKVDYSMLRYFCINGVLLLLAYPLMYLIERTFGFTSNVTLFELSNTNTGVLRKLSEVAPGTFQHSVTVANLAAEIANRIGANSLLVRTGALYHDIGKMTNPAYFTENQSGENPHDKLSPEDSARIIIGHVTEGVKIAEKNNVPSVIKDFIRTHHGRGLVKYFYVEAQNKTPDKPIDKEPFTYPGPNPFTREQAILMMADTVEAASRSLKEYTEESISGLVNKLIDQQVASGAFTECPITFLDIAQSKKVLIERLKAIYHTRIQYPQLKPQSEPKKTKRRHPFYHREKA